MALVAIMGSQGSGKTTTLNKLRDLGYNIIERKSARSVLSDWGVTLQEVNHDQELTKKFQEEITKRKYEDEKHAIKGDDVWFTERSHADLFTYALITLGKHNEHSKWVDSYYKMCLKYNKHYSNIFYLTAGHFKPEHDGIRGSNEHYQRMVDVTMQDVVESMSQYKGEGYLGQLHVIDSPKLSDRILVIRNYTVASDEILRKEGLLK